MQSVGRNVPCPCGSGKRAKHCCHQLVPGRAPAGDPVAATAASRQNADRSAAGDAAAHFTQATALLAQGKLDAVVGHLESALSLRPDYAEAHLTLGQALWAQGKLVAAAGSLEKGLSLMPDFAEAHSNLGLLYHALGKRDAAVDRFRRALALKPDFTWAHCNLGNVLQAQGNLPAAIESYRAALALKPDHVEAWVNLGNAQNAQDNVDAAVESYRKALAIAPDMAVACVNIGAPLQAQGNLDAAADSFRKALSLKPDFADAHSGLLFVLSFHPGYSPAQRLAEARRYGAGVTARARPHERWHVDPNARVDAGTPLRVGLVSADLRSHPVGFFVESILAHLDPARIELVAYPTLPQEDETTARMKPRFAAWNSLVDLGDEAAAARIHADGIHVLVDLAGHTAHNRLPIFAWKPAPVQASWLGYFATTGVPAIDYLLADRVSVPASHREQFSEAIWYLPDTRFCFTPPADSTRLQPAPLPAARSGCITFGCFQNLLKLNDAVLAVWGRILAALPDARLRLQSGQMRYPAAQTRLRDRLRRFGIAPERVTMVGNVPREEYLKAHADVDIILDTFPYPGATTTCEALWMGVPTLTLAGDTLVSRQGASLLACAGLDDWIAADEDDYVARAVAHAGDVDRLARLRSALRPAVLASPLFDAPRFARNLEAALHGMWEEQRRQRSAGRDA
jgi:predicted O-linked N-acetylglucosamine transferase (SPINDLY family)